MIGADLGFAILKKRRETGGYIGHERVARELVEGAPVKRVGLSIEGKLPAREGRRYTLPKSWHCHIRRPLSQS